MEGDEVKCNKTISRRYEKSVFFLVLFSTFMLVQFKIVDLFWVMQVLFCMAYIVLTKNKKIVIDKWILVLYVVWGLSTFFCLFSSIPLSYKKSSIIGIVQLIPIFLSVVVYSRHVVSESFVESIKKAIIISCIIQLIWCLIQFLLYKCFSIDLNQVVFRDILHMVENPSQYKLGNYHPSGLCWHSAFMAPIVIIAFVFSENYIVKILAIIDAVICNNATAMIGIGVCLIMSIGFYAFYFLKEKTKKIKKRTIFGIIAIVVIFILVLFNTEIFSIVIEKIVNIYERATGISRDGSSVAHIRYYLAYPKVVDDENIIQFLFGYGTSNSGYPISKLFGQYADLKSWAVESDIMNQLYSSGIFGFLIFYGLLLYIAIRGLKIDKRYFILMISLILAGITYNIQFHWVIFIEFLMYFCVRRRINIFQIATRVYVEQSLHDEKNIL